MLIEFESNDPNIKLLMRGVMLGDISASQELEKGLAFYHYPEFSKYDKGFRFSKGICDDLVNVLEVFPELLYEGVNHRKFVVVLTTIDPHKYILNNFKYIGTKYSNSAELFMYSTSVLKYAIYEGFDF